MCKASFALALLCFPAAAIVSGQERAPASVGLDERLAAIEDRLDALEGESPSREEADPRSLPADSRTLESEAKLDRLEVRVIQLETGSANCSCADSGDPEIAARLRSLERQVARLRATAIR